MHVKKKAYSAPRLVAYGRVIDVTQGSGGAKLDYIFTGSLPLIAIASACSATDMNVTSCLVFSV